MTTKRRSIISYDKLTVEQKKKLEHDFPEGFLGNLTTIKTPTGEVLDALIWETEEIIYLVKLPKVTLKSPSVDDDEDDDFEDDFDSADAKGEEDDVADDDDDDDDYGDAPEEADDEDKD